MALAALSLLVFPTALAYDPWAWLVWGRELAQFDLDTGAGPSWKPLPVAITALISPAGDAAPTLWLVVARTAWLASTVLVYRVTARLAGPAGGVFAAVTLLLLDDPDTPWVRHFGAGLSEALVVLLALLALDRELSGSRRWALALSGACGLLRPEAWVITAAYAVWTVRRDPALRAFALAAILLPPAIWLGGDALGSGDPFSGGRRAMLGDTRAPDDLGDRLGAAWDALVAAVRLVPLLAWPAAAYALFASRPRSLRVVRAIALMAAVWIAAVCIEAFLGFAPLGRFSILAAGLLSVVAGVGFGSALELTAQRRALVIALGVAAAVLAIPRFVALPDEVRAATDQAAAERELLRAVDAAELPLRGCDRVQIDWFVQGPAVAWALEYPLRGVIGTIQDARPGIVIVSDGTGDERPLAPGALVLARDGRWAVAAYECGSAASARAGVDGATR